MTWRGGGSLDVLDCGLLPGHESYPYFVENSENIQKNKSIVQNSNRQHAGILPVCSAGRLCVFHDANCTLLTS